MDKPSQRIGQAAGHRSSRLALEASIPGPISGESVGFEGAVCVPSAWRRKWKTTSSRTIGVTAIRIASKSAIHLTRTYGERKQNFVGQHFWARGYLVSSVGKDEGVIRDYIRNQEVEDE